MVWNEENPLQPNMVFSTQSLSLKNFQKKFKNAKKSLYST